MTNQADKKEFVTVAEAMKNKATNKRNVKKSYVAIYHINDKRSVAVGGKASTIAGALSDARDKFAKGGLNLADDAEISVVFQDPV